MHFKGGMKMTTKEKSIEENIETSEKMGKAKSQFAKATECIGFFAASIALLSVLSTVATKYISLGRCFWFDFDLDYYDFSLSGSTCAIMIYSVAIGLISSVISTAQYLAWHGIQKMQQKRQEKKPFSRRKAFLYKAISVLLLVIALLIVVMTICLFFVPNPKIAAQYSTTIILLSEVLYIYINLFQPNAKKSNFIKIVGIIAAAVIIILIQSSFQRQYDSAKSQTTFPIITDVSTENTQYYVVISQGKEQYSAYLCTFDQADGLDALKIVTDVHKYFSINDTKTLPVQFKTVKKVVRTALTVDEILTSDK